MSSEGIKPDGGTSKATLNGLFKKLLQDGKGWLEAEFKLAKAEAGHRLRNFAMAAGIDFVGSLILIGTLVVLAQAFVILLTPYVSGPGLAGLIVGLILLVVVLILAFVAKQLLTKKMPSMFTVRDNLNKANRKTARSASS